MPKGALSPIAHVVIYGSGSTRYSCGTSCQLVPTLTSSMTMDEDPFDSLLSLEDQYHKEGFDVGIKDGKRAGLIEGRLFGLENGFEKHFAMGKLHGRATVWAGRVVSSDNGKEKMAGENTSGIREEILPRLHNPRLDAHVRTLYALTEPGSLATENNEDTVADFDDRLKRAEGKVKVIEKLTGEANQDYASRLSGDSKAKRDGEIEDTSVLSARH